MKKFFAGLLIIAALFIFNSDCRAYTQDFPSNATSDGNVYKWDATTWSATRDAASGNGAGSESTLDISTYRSGSSTWSIYRVYIPFDTSGLPDNAIVTAASLYIHINNSANGVIGNPTVRVVRLDPTVSATSARVTSDFSKCKYASGDDPPLKMANDTSYVDADENTWKSISLNDDGIAWINKTGYTVFGIRDATYDVANSTPPDPTNIALKIDAADSSYDPYLRITYTVPFYSPEAYTDEAFELNNTTGYVSPSLVQQYLPTSEGATIQCAPSSGTDNALMVDDPIGANDGGSTYTSVSQQTSYQTDLFNYNTSALYGGGVISSVKVIARCDGGYDATTTGYIKLAIRYGGTTYYGSEQTIAYDNNFSTDFYTTWSTRPGDSAAWTWSNIEDMQFGYQIKTSSGDWRHWTQVTQVYVEITIVESLLGRTSSNNYYDAGFRFNLTDIVEDDIFEFARLVIPASKLDLTTSDKTRVTVSAQEVTSTTAFNTTTQRPSQKTPLTTATVTWDINKSDYNTVIPASVEPFLITSPDISGVIEEVIANTGWGASDKNLIILLDDGSTASTQNLITYRGKYLSENTPQFPVALELYKTIYDCIILKEMASRVTDTTATIALTSLIPLEVKVTYRIAGSASSWTTTNAVTYDVANYSYYIIEHQITGLAGNTRYEYKLQYRKPSTGEFVDGDLLYFRTQRATGSTFSFIITSDNHFEGLMKSWAGTAPSGGEEYTQNHQTGVDSIYAQQQTNDTTDFIFDMGDWYGFENVRDIRSSIYTYVYSSHISRNKKLQSQYLVLGNHESEHSGNPGNYVTENRTARKLVIPNPDADGGTVQTFYKTPNAHESYYAFEWGDALFVILDPFCNTTGDYNSDSWNWTLGETQYDWLYDTLTGSNKPWKFVFIHQLVGGKVITDNNYGQGGIEWVKYSVVSNGPTAEWGGENVSGTNVFTTQRSSWQNESRGCLHDLMVNAGVTAVFKGHDHLYANQQLGGMFYITVPPLHGRYGFDDNYGDGFKTEADYTQGTIVNTNGYVKVTITSNVLCTIEYVGTIRGVDESAQGYTNGQIRNTGTDSYPVGPRFYYYKRRLTQ